MDSVPRAITRSRHSAAASSKTDRSSLSDSTVSGRSKIRTPRTRHLAEAQPILAAPAPNPDDGRGVQGGVAPLDRLTGMFQPLCCLIAGRGARPGSQDPLRVPDLLTDLPLVGARVRGVNVRAQALDVVLELDRRPCNPAQLGKYVYRQLIWHGANRTHSSAVSADPAAVPRPQ